MNMNNESYSWIERTTSIFEERGMLVETIMIGGNRHGRSGSVLWKSPVEYKQTHIPGLRVFVLIFHGLGIFTKLILHHP